MSLRHYVKLFATSIVDRIARPNDFSQQACAIVEKSTPVIPACGIAEVLFC